MNVFKVKSKNTLENSYRILKHVISLEKFIESTELEEIINAAISNHNAVFLKTYSDDSKLANHVSRAEIDIVKDTINRTDLPDWASLPADLSSGKYTIGKMVLKIDDEDKKLKDLTVDFKERWSQYSTDKVAEIDTKIADARKLRNSWFAKIQAGNLTTKQLNCAMAEVGKCDSSLSRLNKIKEDLEKDQIYQNGRKMFLDFSKTLNDWDLPGNKEKRHRESWVEALACHYPSTDKKVARKKAEEWLDSHPELLNTTWDGRF